jgi:hypothetical protein
VSARWLLLVLGLLVSCTGFCGDHVAEIETQSGKVQRDVAKARENWVPAEQGDQLYMGDGLRTGPDSTARLALHPEGTAVVEPNTVMRFLERLPGDMRDRITLEEGAIELEATQLELEVHTPRAVAKIAQGTRLRIRAQSDDVVFDVLVGRVSVDHDGQTEEVSPGEKLTVEGPADKERPPEPSPTDDPEEPQGRAAAVGPAGSGRADFSLDAPESATIHAPSLPVEVRVRVGSCNGGPSTLQVIGASGNAQLTPTRGSEHVVARLGAGNHRLRVRCGKEIRQQAILRVQRDPATMELPKSAQRVEVEADGRRYTVRYQNVLPVVSFTWPNPPPSPSYKLRIRRKDRELRYDLTRATHELRSGELGEGDHQFHFESSSGQKSAEGSLRIVFDNTARSAYLSSPVEGSSGDREVVVAGAALLRSQVSVDGVPVVLDAQGRFRISLPGDPARSAMAVRVSHPVTGVHYYLRRLR